ncbi:MAG: hypothetical protein ABI967_01225 [bacterium]
MNVTPTTYCDVFDAFERHKVPYVVVSGMAVLLHGYIRPVFDLDIVIASTPDEQNRALYALELSGFVGTLNIPLNMLTVLRMFDQNEREIDVFVKYHIPFDKLWSDALEIQVGESTARVVSLEHLMRAKQITGRPHDLLDVEGLRLFVK